ncbi:MAG: hypothetical protein GX654_18955 [Desulfatiglans sp.]|jgi:hypothetical protein|nr:hypothetical protein [Desulfatiglans sp.]
MQRYNSQILVSGFIILASLIFTGCKSWEYDVDKNGIHFKKIFQPESGTVIGYMTEDHEIDGFPCEKGWIHFREDSQLRLFQLSKDFMYKGTLLPAHTWFLFPYNDVTGHICAFPYDYMVQGYLCKGSGGPKGVSTAFYDSGKLRSFYPTEEVMIDGVPCKTTLLVNINLHENGNLKSCKLAEDYQIKNNTIRKGMLIEFDDNGKLK